MPFSSCFPVIWQVSWWYCTAPLMGLPTPLAPVQLLFINLLTDSLPALAIGMEPVDESLLKEPPRDPNEGILTKDFLLKLGYYGLLIGIATMVRILFRIINIHADCGHHGICHTDTGASVPRL